MKLIVHARYIYKYPLTSPRLYVIVVQRLYGASLRESEKIQPRLPDPDQRMFRNPGSSVGQIW